MSWRGPGAESGRDFGLCWRGLGAFMSVDGGGGAVFVLVFSLSAWTHLVLNSLHNSLHVGAVLQASVLGPYG